MPRKGFRTQDAPEFSAGNTREVKIQRRNVVSYHLLRTRYDWDVTGGTGVGSILSDAAYRIPREITVQAGGNPMHNFFGHSMAKLVALLFPEEFAQTDPTTLAAGGSETDRESLVPIPYFQPHSVQPDAQALPTTVADPRLIVAYGTGADLADGEDGAAALSNVSTDLIEAGLFGHGMAPEGFSALSIRKQVRQIPQTGEYSIELSHLEPRMDLRGILIEGMHQDNADEYVHSDSVVTEIGPFDLDGSQEEWQAVAAEVIQNRNKVEYQRSALEVGTYFLDAAEDGRTLPGSLWRVQGREKPSIRVQATAGANDTRVVVTTLSIARPNAVSARR